MRTKLVNSRRSPRKDMIKWWLENKFKDLRNNFKTVNSPKNQQAQQLII